MLESSDAEAYKLVLIALDKRVWTVYNELQAAVDNMDRKVQLIMQKHQSQFLYAYRTHIHKMKKQLQDIKKKSEQQQRLFSSNDRIQYLQKQNIIFREEAIKLYHAIQKKSIELQIAKQKSIEAQTISKKIQLQNKQLAMQVKRMLSNQQQHTRKLQQSKKLIDDMNEKINTLQHKIKSQRSRRDFMSSLRQNASSLAKSRESSPRQFKPMKNQLQDWFLQCVKTVKKEVYQRKNSFDSLDLNKIKNINDFRLVDKLRLFELLLQNEKLLNWLYHKIFPDQFDKISQYLSEAQSPSMSELDNKSDINTNKSDRYGSAQQAILLPKVSSKKIPSFSLRNQLVIKNGKINISIG